MSKCFAIENEQLAKELDAKNKDNDSKVRNDDDWTRPKKLCR